MTMAEAYNCANCLLDGKEEYSSYGDIDKMANMAITIYDGTAVCKKHLIKAHKAKRLRSRI